MLRFEQWPNPRIYNHKHWLKPFKALLMQNDWPVDSEIGSAPCPPVAPPAANM